MTAAGEDILAWLNDAIASREQIAFDALNYERGAVWQAIGSVVEVVGGLAFDADVFEEVVVFDEGSPTEEQAAHIAANDPESVLRRCAADRKLLELHQPVSDRFGWGPDDDATEGAYGTISQACSTCGAADDAVRFPCPTIRILAEGYGWTEGER